MLDHIVFAVADLSDGIRQLHDRLGVAPVYGGFHPTGVTKNALLSLGDGHYLELVALRDDIETPEERRWMLETEVVKPIGWAASSNDIEHTRAVLADADFPTSDVIPGGRETPDGHHLAWSTTSLTERVIGAPFFIQWSADTPHPSTTSPTGCTLQSMTVATPDYERLSELMSVLDIDVTVEPSDDTSPSFTLVVETPQGAVTLS